ncbi:putative aldehyde dehydrogenase-like protein C21C3 [Atractiella rhizophila]|nr:putative aldehyde dehydrogenase-like protein C21C3 [Atractiella rhizophila]
MVCNSPTWKGETLKKPTIFSHLEASSPAAQLYNSQYGTTKSTCVTAFDPATGQLIDVVPVDTPQSISEKIAKATSAQVAWGQSSFKERRKLCRTLLEWTRKDADSIVKISCRDSGKTSILLRTILIRWAAVIDAYFGEILPTLEKLRYMIEEGEKALTPDRRPTPLLMKHKVCEVRYEPLGVVAALVSWNYPFHNLLSPIIASLFAGNAIVIKPSEAVAWSSLEYIKSVKGVLKACNFDPELVQVRPVYHNSLNILTSDPRLAHITFIGSVEVGRLVAEAAAKAGTQVCLELGGKDPAIVLEDADLETFKATFLRGVGQSGGQNCIGIERILVHEKKYEAVVKEMEKVMKPLRCGSALASWFADGEDKQKVDVGSMISDRSFDGLEKMIQGAVKEGARVLVGGKRFEHPTWKEGYYFQPTLLVDVKKDMAIAQQECFAPIAAIYKFSTVDEAIEIANSTKYGLGASVFGRSKKACDYVISRLKCGMVSSNDFATYYMNQSLPFGGHSAKRSGGYGRFAGPEGLRALCNLKSVVQDRFHGVIQTSIPPHLQYPNVGDKPKAAWEFVQGVGELGYGGSAGFLSGLGRMAKAARGLDE